MFSHMDILMVDKMGILDLLYESAELAIVGGGFDGEIHNTIEPAVFGTPTLFGAKHQKAPEAHMLLKKGYAHEFKEKKDMSRFIHDFIKRYNAQNTKEREKGPYPCEALRANIPKTVEIVSHTLEVV
jgi:3-deoxy-D-manno-octulosonic-acid transferase